MLSPGIKDLGDITITTAGRQEGEWVTDLEGMLAASSHLTFVFGSGGGVGGVKAYLQTRFGEGGPVMDIASFVFGTANAAAARNNAGLEPADDIVPTDATLPDDTTVQGMLGDALRLVVVSTGTYANNTVLSGRAAVR